jgi:class 3 adenylate cyclase
MFDLRAQHEVMPEDHRLFYGIGIHTGTAVLGNVGGEDRKEFTAIGDALNISKYLEGNAEPGEVVISQSTFDIVKAAFECEPIEELRRPKPGYEHVWPIYRVVRRKKGVQTGPLMVDAELLELLEELKDD